MNQKADLDEWLKPLLVKKQKAKAKNNRKMDANIKIKTDKEKNKPSEKLTSHMPWKKLLTKPSKKPPIRK
jgi:hypothetical protein